jgi:hypothetical protein
MINLGTVVSWAWKIPVCGATMAAGTIVGHAAATALGLEMPRAVSDVSPDRQFAFLLLGAMAFAAGLAAMNARMTGSRRERWLLLAMFGFVVNGIGNTLEASIFSTVGGTLAMLVMKLPSTLLCALAVVLLFASAHPSGLRERLSSWSSGWPMASLAARLVVGLVAFPVIYFVIGMLIVPIVTPYWDALDFLVIPPFPTILVVLFTRSLLLLLVSVPVVASWNGTRGRLVLALGLGHFVAVGLTDLLQAPFFPAVMRWTHGVEILVDSMLYALVLARLLLPRQQRGDEQAQALRPQHA